MDEVGAEEQQRHTDRFVELVNQSESEIALDEAMFLIAAHGRLLDIDAERARLDEVAAEVAEPTLEALRFHLYGTLGLRGDTDYDDPRNSYLPLVLNRRRGIPISLAVLLMEIGRRAGVALAGVGMPGHFLLRPLLPPSGVWLDPVAGAVALDETGCRALLARLHPDLPFERSMLADTGPREILARVLNNLHRSNLGRGDITANLWVTRLRAAIPGAGPRAQVDRAEALAAGGRYGEAADALEALGPSVPDEVGARIERRAVALRARLN